jgi:hypothetical protein
MLYFESDTKMTQRIIREEELCHYLTDLDPNAHVQDYMSHLLRYDYDLWESRLTPEEDYLTYPF